MQIKSLFIMILLFSFSFNVYASCDSSYRMMVIKIEAAASASANKDMCATADALEAAINYADDAKSSCSDERKYEMESWIRRLSSQLFTAIDHCGK